MKEHWFPRCGGSCSRNCGKVGGDSSQKPSASVDDIPDLAPDVQCPEGKLLASTENFDFLSPMSPEFPSLGFHDPFSQPPLADVLSLSDIKLSPDVQLQHLPDNVFENIFSYFPPQVLRGKLSLVCQRWDILTLSPSLWHCIDLQLASLQHSWELKRFLERISRYVKEMSLMVNEVSMECAEIVGGGTVPLLSSLCLLDLGFNLDLTHPALHFFLDQCPNLTSLNIEGINCIDDKSVEIVSTRLPNLRELCISHCTAVTNEGISSLAQSDLPLTMLNIDGINNVSDECVIELGRCKKETLERLYLDGENVTDEAMFGLSCCTKLRLLSISFTEGLSDSSLLFLRDLVNLEHLHLRKGQSFTASGVEQLFSSGCVSKIQYLNLAECTAVNDECVIAIVKCCPGLRSLCLSWCWSISEEGLSFLIHHLPFLELLCLEGVKLISGMCFDNTQGGDGETDNCLSRLVFLDLRMCNMIDDNTVLELVRRKKDLTAINYYGEIVRIEPSDAEVEDKRRKAKTFLDNYYGGCCMTGII